MENTIILTATSQTDLQYEVINNADFGYMAVSEVTKNEKGQYQLTLKQQ